MTDARARAALPIAARLIAAVAVEDAAEIEHILTRPGLDWQALAVVLADQAALPQSMPNGVAAVFTPEERRRLHAAYTRGCRDAQSVLGEREYQRERKRDRGPSPEVLDEHCWVTRPGGVKVYQEAS